MNTPGDGAPRLARTRRPEDPRGQLVGRAAVGDEGALAVGATSRRCGQSARRPPHDSGLTPSSLTASTRARPAGSRPTAATSVVRAPSRASQRAVLAADPPWTSDTRPGTSVPRSSGRAGARTTSTMRSPSTTIRAGPLAARRVGRRGRGGRGARNFGMGFEDRRARAASLGARLGRTYNVRPSAARAGVPPDDHCRDARPRPPRDRHDSDPLDRRRPAGELRASRRPDGRGADGVRALDAVPPPLPDEPGMARPGPLRAVGRACLDAPLLAAPPDRLRPPARGAHGVPSVGLANAGTPGIGADAGGRGNDRAARSGVRQRRRDGHRRAAPRGRVQWRRRLHRRSSDVRHRQRRRPPGGHRLGGGQPCRAPATGQIDRAVRRQPHPARRPDGDGVLGGCAEALRGLRLAHPAGRRRQRRRRHRIRRSRRPATPTTGRA